MRLTKGTASVWVALLTAVVLVTVGCMKVERKGKQKGQHDHSGWWCDEHGVPEDVCSQCDKKVAKEFKDKGDWCEEHKRAKSQCFICDPALKEKFAKEYRAKYGKEPPPVEEK